MVPIVVCWYAGVIPFRLVWERRLRRTILFLAAWLRKTGGGPLVPHGDVRVVPPILYEPSSSTKPILLDEPGGFVSADDGDIR